MMLLPGSSLKGGLHPARHDRRRCAAELERATAAGEPDWCAVAQNFFALPSPTLQISTVALLKPWRGSGAELR
jgi:hypothetical protein